MLKKIRYILLHICLGLISFSCYSAISFYHYGTKEGLTEPRIFDIAQDSSGFIWLAGEYSLTRFDGKVFKEFTHGINRPQPWNKINEIFIDADGTLWLGSDTGFSFYNAHTDEFKQPSAMREKISVNDFADAGNNNLFLATNSGLASYDKIEKKISWLTGPKVQDTTNLLLASLTNLIHVDVDNEGKIWLSTFPTGLYLYNPEENQVTKMGIVDGFALSNLTINHHDVKNNKLLLATIEKGFLEVDLEKEKVEKINFDTQTTVQHFHFASDSIVWLATDNGLIKLNFFTKQTDRYTNIPIDPLSMSRTAVLHVITDKENNLWLSNGIRGIDFGLNNIIFEHMMLSNEFSYTVSQKEVTAIDTDNYGNIWVGYESGLIEKNSYLSDQKKKYYLNSPGTAQPGGAIFKILHDSKNRLWAAGWKSGLFKLNEATNQFEKASTLSDSSNLLRNADIRDIVEDRTGKLWLTLHGTGLARYEPETGEIKLYRFNENVPEEGISNDFTYNLCFDFRNNLWISTAYGVTKMNLQSEEFTTYIHQGNDSLSLTSNRITTVHCDRNGNIWAGTDNGLNIYMPELDKFQPIPTNHDFSFLIISAIESVKQNEIWASTKSGIFRLIYSKNKSTGLTEAEIDYFYPSNGLISSVYFNRSSTTNDNIIFFGGNEGIDFFNPYNQKEKPNSAPEIVITEASVYGKPVNPLSTKNGQLPQLILSHNQKMISFRFTAPNFTNPEQQKYRYMLDDFDDQWIYTQNEQVATYTSLPKGNYTFKVEVTDKNGNWRESQSAVFNLKVKPPFWQTVPFILIAVSGIIALFFLFQRLRYRAMRMRQLELEKTVDDRTKELQKKNRELRNANRTKNKFFSIISHDLRSPFAGLMGILEILNDPDYLPEEQKKSLTKSAYQTAQNTFSLLENLLTWAHSQTKRIEFAPEVFDLAKLLEKNIQLGKEIANQKGIRIRKAFNENNDVFGDVNMIDTVIRNILNNAIKFTENGGSIEVKVKDTGNKVTVSIADSGIGMTPEQIDNLFDLQAKSSKGTNGENGTGLGLLIGKEFIHKNNGEIWATKNTPGGTVFHFTIPKAKHPSQLTFAES